MNKSSVIRLQANPASYASRKNDAIRPVQSINSKAKVGLPHSKIYSCLLIKKRDCPSASQALKEVAEYIEFRGITVFVEPVVSFSEFPRYRPWSSDDSAEYPDFCICVGGDGTLLHLNSLFQSVDSGLPPVLSFAGGSLGFLTPLKLEGFKQHIDAMLKSHIKPVNVTPRMRLHCSIVRHKTGRVCEVYQPLNELVVKRSGAMCELQLHVDHHAVTTVKADGLILSTPTGSTAYSMSAGGPMVAPNVPCITVTPVCPHSLSMRPIVLSDTSIIRLVVPRGKNNGDGKHMEKTFAWAAFDGREQIDLRPGDTIIIRTSPYSFPSVAMQKDQVEWLDSIQNKLHWNADVSQQPMLMLSKL